MNTAAPPATSQLPDFGALFDALPTPILVLSPDLTIVAANQAYLRASKTVRENILGRGLFEVFPDNPDDPTASGVARVHASLQRVLRTRQADTMAIQKYDIQVTGPDGVHFEERHWSPVNMPLLGADGEITHLIHCTEDVSGFVLARESTARMASTIDHQALEIELANRRLREANELLEQRMALRTEAQRLAEEQLRASEVRFRLLADSIPQIIWIIDHDGRAVYFNKQWAAYTGFVPDVTAPAAVISEFVHPDDRAATVQAWTNALESGQHYSVEHRLRSASGEYRWFLVRAEAYREQPSDAVAMWFGTSTDVHDRKLAESALGAREEQLRLAMDAADIGEWDVDMVNGTLFWPPSVKAMFGIPADEPITLADFYQGVHPDDREHTYASFADTANPALRVQYQAEYRTIGKHDGVVRWIAAKGRGLFNDAGQCIRIIGTAMDISARKAAEQALRDSEERLRQADRRKDEFLAMLAHELRNPLAPISAAAELLQIGRLDEQRVQRTSQIIGRQVRHMTSLVDDLLDVSRVTRGLVELDRTPLDVNQIVSDAVEQVSPLIRSRRHELELRLAPRASMLLGDRKRLVQVLANVLNNAAKYTPEGGRITLRTELHTQDQDERVLIEVADDGIGMAPELAARAFDLFAQAERSSDRALGGLGLGLALVKSLVELHHGTVTCASPGPGRGSRFTICLPLLAQQHERRSEGRPSGGLAPDTPALRIMVVDDNVDAAAMLAMLLEAAGHQVAVEHDARAALRHAGTQRFDACVLDIGLPDVDGNELARRLRAVPGFAGTVLIAATGYGQEEDRRRSLAAGFDHHLVKPIDTRALAAILERIVQARTALNT